MGLGSGEDHCNHSVEGNKEHRGSLLCHLDDHLARPEEDRRHVVAGCIEVAGCIRTEDVVGWPEGDHPVGVEEVESYIDRWPCSWTAASFSSES